MQTRLKIAGAVAAGVLAFGFLSPAVAQDASASSSDAMMTSSSSALCDTSSSAMTSDMSSMDSSSTMASEGQVASGEPPGSAITECSDTSMSSGMDMSSSSAM